MPYVMRHDLMVCVQVASAFASVGGSPEGPLDIHQLRLAMIMVLGRAVRESEAEFHLRALRESKAHGKHVEEQLDETKVKYSGSSQDQLQTSPATKIRRGGGVHLSRGALKVC